MSNYLNTTVVTAGDRAFAWGTLLMVASMRRNGMRHPVVVGAMDWSDDQKRRILSLGGVTIRDLPKSRQCVTCQKPLLMNLDEITTDWVCWADSDAIFVGDCSEWLRGDDPGEIVVRMYSPPPADFTPATRETWRRDVERHCGRALPESRYPTRVNAPFIVIHRKWRPFLERWQNQIGSVLPADVEIIMRRGSPYFQTDESVLGSLLCFDPDAPKIAENYKANGGADKTRYFAHFAYNPKPWQMWNRHSSKWRGEVFAVVDWLVAQGVVRSSEVPLPLRRRWWPLFRAAAPAAPWVWRAIKAKRRLLKK
ncbi:MAG: hypothetical protein IJP66_03020 [Kiritimatiellae bacterium]|nr:hypothetical protein [Kiritimatiellia bacterium]